jgi:hypothetical protein
MVRERWRLNNLEQIARAPHGYFVFVFDDWNDCSPKNLTAPDNLIVAASISSNVLME